MNRVLVVDDEAGMRAALEARFLRRGWRVDLAAGATEAIAKFRRGLYPLVITDIRMPDGDGLSVMRAVRSIAPGTPVILLTAFANVTDAVEAMKSGACDYLVKPVCFEQLESAVGRVLNASRGPAQDVLLGKSTIWLRALERARKAAATDADILIEAESGTGKELVARMIHSASARRDRPLIAVNCAAFPETLLESELFGHIKGAFTGAVLNKPGKFELADGGTLLLDEVGEMPITLQPKLLRALQEREFYPLGGTRSVRVNIRVIATTNRSLRSMVEVGKFRSDLYYRLNVIPLALPPLRERNGDVTELASHFAKMFAPAGTADLTPEFISRLEAHTWPGNVRELSNFIRRVVALGNNATLDLDGMDETRQPPVSDRLQPGLSLEAMEKRLLELTLDANRGNRSRTAEMMGVSLRTIRNKIRDYGLPSRRSYSHD